MVMYSNMKVRISFHFNLNFVIVCLTTRTSGQNSANVAGSTPLFFCSGMQDDCENIKGVIVSLPPHSFSFLPLHSEMK